MEVFTNLEELRKFWFNTSKKLGVTPNTFGLRSLRSRYKKAVPGATDNKLERMLAGTLNPHKELLRLLCFPKKEGDYWTVEPKSNEKGAEKPEQTVRKTEGKRSQKTIRFTNHSDTHLEVKVESKSGLLDIEIHNDCRVTGATFLHRKSTIHECSTNPAEQVFPEDVETKEV